MAGAKIPSWDETIEIPAWDQTEDPSAPEKFSRDDVSFLGSDKAGPAASLMFPRAAKASAEGKGYGGQVGASLLDLLSLPGRGIGSTGEAPKGGGLNEALGDTKGKGITQAILRDPGAAAAAATAPFTGGLPLLASGAIAGAGSAAAHQGEKVLEGGKASPLGAAGEVALNAVIPAGLQKLGKPLQAAGKGFMQSILKPSKFLREKTNLDMGTLIETLGSMRPFKGSVRGMGKKADALEGAANTKYGDIVAQNADTKINPKEALSKTGLGFQKEFEVGKKHLDVIDGLERGGKKINDLLARQGVEDGGNPLPQAVEVRKSIGRMGKYNANKDPKDLEGEAQFARQMYDHLSDQEAKAVPDLVPVKDELHRLYPMQEAVANAQGARANNFYPGLTDNLALNAMAQADKWEKTIPGTAMFLANRTFKNPAAATGIYKLGKALEGQGPGVSAAQAALLRSLGAGFRED